MRGRNEGKGKGKECKVRREDEGREGRGREEGKIRGRNEGKGKVRNVR